MPTEIIEYFTAEKQEALLFMVVGVIAIAVSVWLYGTGSAYKAAAFPLVIIAAIQLIVGSTVYFRTDDQVSQLSTLYEQDPATFQSEETERMQVVIDNFVTYRWIEIGLLLTGIALAVLLRSNPAWLAIGVGLAVQSGIMLALDLFAERRAAEYMQFLAGVGA